jgi:prepilin-type N-terminal cleavage/methylation domain-containing protein
MVIAKMAPINAVARGLHRNEKVAMRSKKNKGFTLVELMIVVAIIGVIAAIAVPAFTRYVKRSRTAETPGILNKEWAGSVSYYMTDFTGAGSNSTPLPRQFPGPTGSWELGTDCCTGPGGRCPGGSTVWNTDGVWLALKFSMPDAHYYLPGYSGSGTGTSAQFTAYARGNLNCDTKYAEFSRLGTVAGNGDVTGSSQATVVNELE